MYYETFYDVTDIINYCRRSRQDIQKEKLTGEDTLASQRKLMKSVLDKMKIPYEQRSEIGSGDKIETRPIFKEVLKDIKKGKFDAIAVKEISRLSRGNYTDAGIIYDLIADKGIVIITPYKIYNPTNLSDLKQIRFELFMAREELEQTKERLNGARYNAALEGKWMGQIPFGYERITEGKENGRLKPVEKEADIIKLIFDLYINGYEGKQVKERAISTILKRLNIKTAKGCQYWDTTQLTRILTNEAYIGVSKFRTTKRTSSGKVEKRPEKEHIRVEDAHEAIIEKEAFYKVQEIMKSHVPKTRLDAEVFELTGILTCKHCGRKLVVNRYKRKRLNDEYYDTYVKCREGCFTVKYEFVEKGIINLLNHLKEADIALINDMYSKSVEKQNEMDREALKQEMKTQAESKKLELKRKLNFFQDKWFEQKFTDEEFHEKSAEIKAELKEIEKMLDGNLNNEIAATKEIDSEKVHEKFIKIIDTYNKAKSASAKNELLRSIFENSIIEVIEKGTKKKEPKIGIKVTLKANFWKGSI